MTRPSARARVSIVIPFFGRSEQQVALLDATLATVDAQTVDDYEAIVIDDGSPVDVSKMVARHRHARLARQANAGSAVARNHGIALSRGESFVFLDADDYLLPGALEVMLDALIDHPDAGFVVGPREEMTFEGKPVPWSVAPPPMQSDLYVPLLGFDWHIIPPSSVIFRRAVVERVGGFRDPWGADDLDFYLRAAGIATAWCFQSPPITRYRRYSASSSRDGIRMLDSIRVVYERQRPIVDGDEAAQRAFDRGLAALTRIFVDCLAENVLDRLRARDRSGAAIYAARLAREDLARWKQLAAAAGLEVAGLAARELSP